MKTISLVAIILFFVSGCAAIFHGAKEEIYVRSEEPDTQFYLNNRNIGKGTFAEATIAKKELGTSVLLAEKKGCNSKSTSLKTSFDGITLLGILIDFGLISILVVDWGWTGAVTKAAQTNYVITPECPKMTTPASTEVPTPSK